MTADKHWWQQAIFYQIYPRSFCDGNGDGIGDFQGIIERLDYLKTLGIDAIWLSPHYPSPLFDCGYDISDYTDVAPEYGGLDHFQRFLDAVHERGMRVILDLVLNHTSDQHPWFAAARSNRADPKRDWYIWRDGRNDGPPNNWISGFGGPAWQYDAATGQWYYHFFFPEQPDLNWRNPEVKRAMWDAARFWLDRGVDGFRLDAIGTIFEDPLLTDNHLQVSEADIIRAISAETGDPEHAALMDKREEMTRHQVDQPGLHELMRELRTLTDAYPDRMLVGETEDIAYCGTGNDELHLVFNFPLMKTSRLTPAWVRTNQQLRLAACPPPIWPCNTLGNHDSSRLISRFSDGHDAEWARLGAALMLTLQGTPFFYYGEELGMTDLLLEDVAQFRDMLGVWYYQALVDRLHVAPERARAEAARFTRDKCRTPMQWHSGPNAGFSPASAAPWLPVHPNHAQGVNVADQERDPDSLLNFYRGLITLRRATPALRDGAYADLGRVDADDECLAFVRYVPGQACLVVLNMGGSPHALDLVEGVRSVLNRGEREEQAVARLLFSSRERRVKSEDLAQLTIEPWEVHVAEV